MMKTTFSFVLSSATQRPPAKMKTTSTRRQTPPTISHIAPRDRRSLQETKQKWKDSNNRTYLYEDLCCVIRAVRVLREGHCRKDLPVRIEKVEIWGRSREGK